MSPILRITAGLLIWAAAFVVVYGLQGLGCALGWHRVRLGSADALRVTLVVAWLLFLGVALLRAWRGVGTQRATQGGSALVARLELGIAVTGAAAIAYTLFPVAWTSACA
jgi:hypothetical protein